MKWERIKYIRSSEDGPVEQHVWDYELTVPESLAKWDVFSYWERERLESMKAHLNNGDVLLDIGAEVGWLSVVYAQLVGPQNMVLIEPTPEFWPNIAQTWQHNFTVPPKATFCGLLSSKNETTSPVGRVWPDEAVGEPIDKLAYTYIHDNPKHVPMITLDSYCRDTLIAPNALTIDVEGAERHVLEGATYVLTQFRPKVWVSIHPDLMEKHYGYTPDTLHAFMQARGYVGTHLATDHEEHWLFMPEETV